MIRLSVVSGVVCAGLLGHAYVEPTSTTDGASPTLTAVGGRRIAVDTPVEHFTRRADASVSPLLYMERCKGGCTVHGSAGQNDAKTYTSSIPNPGTYVIGEF